MIEVLIFIAGFAVGALAVLGIVFAGNRLDSESDIPQQHRPSAIGSSGRVWPRR